MTTSPPKQDLARILLVVLALSVLFVGIGWVLRPFLLAMVWAAMIAIATWPIMLWFQRRLWGRRGAAVAVMVLLLLLLLVVPVSLAVLTIVEYAGQIGDEARHLSTMALPAPPEWIEKLPLVGARLHAGWLEMVQRGPGALAGSLAPYGREAVSWLVGSAGAFGGMLVQFLLTIVVAGILFSSGEEAAAAVRRFFRRLGGSRGEDAVILASQAVRAVALGVVVTAVVQTGLAGIGLAVAGVPHAGVLTAITMVFCIAQIGPTLVLLPTVLWLYSTGATGWAAALLIWSIGVGTIDNVLRPFLIRKGADLPLLLIFAGVLGGLFAFGVVGLFVGPTILAVAWTLVGAWVADLDGDSAVAGE
jgi:predicted PurR-regulated permease PerM